ncbi:hypothetical protein GCM10022626_08200 [[Pseudomonas] carboxydohydrogena]
MGFSSVSGERFVSDEAYIAFDRKPKFAPNALDFLKADPAKFRKAEAEIAETEKAIRIIRIAFADEPGRIGVWCEQFEHRSMVAFRAKRVDEQLDVVTER